MAAPNISITKAQDVTLTMAFSNPDGSDYSLAGSTVTLVIRKDSYTAPVIQRVAGTGGNLATIDLSSVETDLDIRAYQARLTLLDTGGMENTSKVFYIAITERVVVPGEVNIIVGDNDVALDVTIEPPTNAVDKHYQQDFTVSNTLAVAHNLNKRPAVTVVDSAGDEVEVEVIHHDNNNLTLNMASGFSGSVYCN